MVRALEAHPVIYVIRMGQVEKPVSRRLRFFEFTV